MITRIGRKSARSVHGNPPGIMWEVPVLIEFGGTQALILSLVDRRGGRIACSVRYWLGRIGDQGWSRNADFPEMGLPLDYGPDFYAAMINLEKGWPLEERVLVAWASNWEVGPSQPIGCEG